MQRLVVANMDIQGYPESHPEPHPRLEQMGSYWTYEKLEYKHWELLYGQVVANLKYSRVSKPYLNFLIDVRTVVCAELAHSEETGIY